jgi:hypothetical protein
MDLMRQIALVLTLALSLGSCAEGEDFDDDATSKTRTGVVDPAVIRATAASLTVVPAASAGSFAPQTRVGFTVGDQWEPAIAADRFGHVYIVYPQYDGVPGCPACPSPTMVIQMSSDSGATWGTPRIIGNPGAGQWDAQVVVEPLSGSTVYVSWMVDKKSDIVVARSDDFGATFTWTTASHTNAATDKPILVARGNDVYVGYEHQTQVFVAASHDGGATFTETYVNANGKNGVSLAGGAAIDSAGRVYFAWDGYDGGGGAKGKVHLYVSSSANGGATWSVKELMTSAAAPDCSAYLCGWAFLGGQITMTVDDKDKLYALWNAGLVDRGPERIYFSSSTDAGNTWQPARELSTAPKGSGHAFPAIAAVGDGDVRVAWMDTRAGTLWNTITRRSVDGGTNWSAEFAISSYVPGYDYIQPGGFSFPFGDYFEMAIDDKGVTHFVWGEGKNYDTPGSIWYTHGGY